MNFRKIGSKNLTNIIFESAKRNPKKDAIIDGSQHISYSDFVSLISKVSFWLSELNLEPGTHVGVRLVNSITHIILALAIIRAGLVLVEIADGPIDLPINLIGKYNISLLFVEANSNGQIDIPVFKIGPNWLEHFYNLPNKDYFYKIDKSTLCNITLTSGSTGTPRGIPVTHFQYIERSLAYADFFSEADKNSNFLLVAPISISAFFRRLVSQLFSGNTIILLSHTNFNSLMWDISARKNCTCAVTANMCRYFLEFDTSSLLFSNLRALILVGQPLFGYEKKMILEKLTLNFYDSYGSSTFGTISCLLPSEIVDKPNSVGKMPAGVELEIVDEFNKPVATGEIGYLRCKSQGMAEMFYEKDFISTEKFIDGWCYPGEIGYLDQDGYLFLKGRHQDRIFRNNTQIFISEVLEPIMQFQRVEQIVGFELNNQLIVCIVSDEVKNDELIIHLEKKLEKNKLPDRIFYLKMLPKTANGKTDIPKLKQLVQEQIDTKLVIDSEYINIKTNFIH